MRRRAIVGSKGEAPLPYDAEVEYLQGTTATWIDTGVRDVSLDNTDWELFIKTDVGVGATVSSDSKKGHGYYDSKALFCGYTYQQARHLRVNATNKRYSTSGMVEVHVQCKSGKLSATVNGSSIWSNQTMETFTLPAFFLFAHANDNGEYNNNSKLTTIKLAECWLSVGGVKIFDCIPVRVGQVGYMYDKVSKQLRGTASGSFTLGNDVTT